MKLKTALTLATVVLASVAGQAALASPVQQPPVWQMITPTTDPITISWGQHDNKGTIHYSPAPAESIWYYDGNIHNQSVSNILNVVSTQFNLASGVLKPVSSCDNAYGSCTNASDGRGGEGYSNGFTSDSAYNYLAVHFGQGELLFHWANPIAANTQFKIDMPCGISGISNYRAYDAPPPTPTPIPPAILLFASALIGLALTKHQRI